jgi:hypothetical protein
VKVLLSVQPLASPSFSFSEKLATLAGVPRRTIARHEVHADTRLRRDARLKLAKALKVKPTDLA